jgi:hypothetical protein
LVNYSGSNDLKYSGYDGYTRTNRGNNITSLDQSLTFDTIFYFDLTIREYEITIQDVQNADGTVKDMVFRTKYGEKFNFTELLSTGTEKDGVYTGHAPNMLEISARADDDLKGRIVPVTLTAYDGEKAIGEI